MSLYGEVTDHDQGVAVLHATWGGHRLDWFPFTLQLSDGTNPFTAVWGRPSSHDGYRLHPSIQSVLDQWRDGVFAPRKHRTTAAVVQSLHDDGFTWTTEPGFGPL